MVPEHNWENRGRRSTRLSGYDYSSTGAYFVTICVNQRQCLFGEIVDGTMRLSEGGNMIHAVWDALPRRYANVNLDMFMVMPNHVHGIIVLTDPSDLGAGLALPWSKGAELALPGKPDVGAGLALPSLEGAASSAPTLGDVIRTFKSISAVQVNRVLTRTGQPLWQRNYYEHIIRNETSLDRIREYIAMNPQNWMIDQENPENSAAPSDFEKALGCAGRETLCNRHR